MSVNMNNTKTKNLAMDNGQVVTRKQKGPREKKIRDEEKRDRREDSRERSMSRKEIEELCKQCVGKSAPPGAEINNQMLLDSARAQDDPFHVSPCDYPVHHNPVPTVSTFNARTGSGYILVTVKENTTSQLVFGSSSGEAGGVTSGVAFSSRYIITDQVGGPFNMTLGPYQSGAVLSGVGAVTAQLPLGTTASDSLLSKKINTANALPLTNVVGSDVNRYQCTAEGVLGFNVSEMLVRGGSVTTIAPRSGISLDSDQASYMNHESFTIHGDAGDGFMATANFKPTDERYHYDLDLVSATLNDQTLYVFLNNTTSDSQTYMLESAKHWQLGGAQFQQFTGPNFTMPANGNVTQPVKDLSTAYGLQGSHYALTNSLLNKGFEATKKYGAQLLQTGAKVVGTAVGAALKGAGAAAAVQPRVPAWSGDTAPTARTSDFYRKALNKVDRVKMMSQVTHHYSVAPVGSMRPLLPGDSVHPDHYEGVEYVSVCTEILDGKIQHLSEPARSSKSKTSSSK